MTCGSVHASYSLREWQSVVMTFFPPCQLSILITIILITTTVMITGDTQKKFRVLNKSFLIFMLFSHLVFENVVQKVYILQAKISA